MFCPQTLTLTGSDPCTLKIDPPALVLTQTDPIDRRRGFENNRGRGFHAFTDFRYLPAIGHGRPLIVALEKWDTSIFGGWILYPD